VADRDGLEMEVSRSVCSVTPSGARNPGTNHCGQSSREWIACE